jgi:cytochrome oxidase Cu insertion factor (SCO1/SenC/PrrC family)
MMNDHSKVFYLMGADNKFLGFYRLDVDEIDMMD